MNLSAGQSRPSAKLVRAPTIMVALMLVSAETATKIPSAFSPQGPNALPIRSAAMALLSASPCIPMPARIAMLTNT